MNKPEDHPKDCLECRLVSGFGIIAIGCYIFSQAQKRKKLEGNLMKVLSAGAVSVGVARLFNAPFLKKTNTKDHS